MKDEVQDSYFSVSARYIKVGDETIFVFEFEDAETASSQAETISKDGYTIVDKKISWTDEPHFYQKGNLIVGYIGKDEKLLFALHVILEKSITEYSKGTRLYSIMSNKDRWGFIDDKGNVVIKPQYEYAEEFSEGYAAVQKDGKYGYIDERGKMQIPAELDSTYMFSEGLAYFCDAAERKYGYIDKKGNVVITPKYDLAFNFCDGLAIVRVNDKYGFIDKDGNMVVQPVFDYVYSFSEGLAYVVTGYKCGYIDKSGKYVIEAKFAGDASGLTVGGSFSEGLAPAQIDHDSKWGYINKKD